MTSKEKQEKRIESIKQEADNSKKGIYKVDMIPPSLVSPRILLLIL